MLKSSDHMSRRFVPGSFPTQIVRRCEVAGFVLTETGYHPNQTLPNHSHEHANFVYVLRGTFTENVGSRTRWCVPSNVIVRPPGELHTDVFHNIGGRCLTIEVEQSWWKQASEHSVIPKESGVFQNGLLATIMARMYVKFRKADRFSALAIEGLTLEMIAEVSRLSMKNPPRNSACRTERAREIIHAHFAENLSLGSIAESVGSHPVSLARDFRLRYNCTVGEYIRHLRVQFACGEMAKSDATIAEIASAAGFFDQSHFSKTFKRFIGTTPTEYRKTIRPR